MANKYTEMINSSKKEGMLSGITTGIATGSSIGGTIGSAFGSIGTGVGSLAGGLIGGFLGLFTGWAEKETDTRNEIKTEREKFQNQMEAEQEYRNKLISDAKSVISKTRSSFDTTYGEGMFDQYDELFAKIFNLPEGSSTTSDILENLSYDRFSGEISSSVYGKTTEDALVGSMSINDISKTYLEYMGQQLANADTLFGMQMEYSTRQQNALIEDYYSTIESYMYEMSNQFRSLSSEMRTSDISGQTALGEAALSQATSGIRQEGQTLTTMQQFQNDLASVAYASSLNYMIKNIEMQGRNANRSLIGEINDIRSQESMSIREQLENMINSYNEYNQGLKDRYDAIKESEDTIKEYDKEIDEMTEALGDNYNGRYELEDIF